MKNTLEYMKCIFELRRKIFFSTDSSKISCFIYSLYTDNSVYKISDKKCGHAFNLLYYRINSDYFSRYQGVITFQLAILVFLTPFQTQLFKQISDSL